jgi:uncharacterized glyoxalase superfamily protein PhnB
VSNLRVVEIKTFVPAKDFELSKRFYVEAFAGNFMMHLLVEDVDSWRTKVRESGVAGKYGVTVTEVEQRPWRMRDFTVIDPSGVLWRIAQNTD